MTQNGVPGTSRKAILGMGGGGVDPFTTRKSILDCSRWQIRGSYMAMEKG